MTVQNLYSTVLPWSNEVARWRNFKHARRKAFLSGKTIAEKTELGKKGYKLFEPIKDPAVDAVPVDSEEGFICNTRELSIGKVRDGATSQKVDGFEWVNEPNL